MSAPRALAVGALVVLVAGTAACGASSVAPKIQLRDALGAIGAAGAGGFSLSLPSSQEDVQAFLAATGEDDASLDDSMLGELLGIELLAEYDTSGSTDPADDMGRFQLRIGGEDYAELRGVAEVAYFRVDVEGLSERFPEMADDVETLRADMDSVDLGALEPAAEAVLDGDWVSVDAGEGSWLAEQSDALADTSTASAELQQRLLDLVGKAAKSSVTVRSAGEDDTGERLIATVNTRDMYAQVADDLPALAEELAPGAGESVPPASEVPSIDVSASFWVEDGALQRVELDLAQFLDEPTGHFVIRLDALEGTPTIEAPADAVELDLEEVMAQSGASMAGLLGGGLVEGGGTEVEAAAMSVGYDFQYLADTEGVAPTVAHLPMVAEYYAGMEPPLELVAVGDRVQVTYAGASACLTIPANVMTEPVVTPGLC